MVFLENVMALPLVIRSKKSENLEKRVNEITVHLFKTFAKEIQWISEALLELPSTKLFLGFSF